ncbi:UDP-N-acetylmuramoyl-L-alanyl-D-glutamate--2,6-diaminopimelate ligase [Rugosimonospora acidiphila]|uniref:UDP-N-acetylmuramoyl-L-alanyl-D-glutamate--2,6-diaminopimelate ligase n=1 Tax=Rugosimonospora acidiphila TaxID=556531 RepID=A0ABP9SIA1_9ACTN
MPGYPRPRTVPPRPLTDLADLLAAEIGGAADPGTLVSGVTHASDAVRPGDLFAALPGTKVHGARFVPAAAEAGAVAVFTDPAGVEAAERAGLPALIVPEPRALLGRVAAEIYDRPTEKLTVIGITGTAGKTSTAYLIESGLRAAGLSTGLIGTVETRLGDFVIDSERTTPEAGDLQALFAVAVERGIAAVVMEVSSHALALGRVEGTAFTVGGYTNFGTDHLDFHATIEEYFQAKAMLFDGRCQYEVINLDEEALRPLLRPSTITYSAAGDPAATWRATGIESSGFGQRFRAHGPGGTEVDGAVSLPGRHNVANALLALGSLVAAGVAAEVAAIGIAACPGVPGRLERVAAPGPVVGVVDYAHKPDAIVAALAALRHPDAGRLICVIGAGGDRDRGKRPIMGRAAAEGADLVLVTDDNPRTEDPALIRAEVLRGAEAVPGARVIEVPGRRQAIAEAVARAEPGDVVALLGKGHERGQEVDGEVHPFDDRIELARALTERFGDESGQPGQDGSGPGGEAARDGGRSQEAR